MTNRWSAPLLGLLLLSATACDDLLQENPVGTLTPVNFYRNADDALAALNGAYNSFHEGQYVSGWRYAALMENPTPELTSVHTTTQYTSCWDHYVCQTTNGATQDVWRSIYTSINRANAVIDNVPNIQGMNAEVQARVVGEAKFLRAFHYFNLVRMWGGVPLRTSETSDLNNLNVPRSTADEVYAFIIKDLTEAAQALPATYPASDYGRATQGAAQAMLGKVYLQRGVAGKTNPFGDPLYWPSAQSGDLDAAIAQLRALVNSGRYSLVPDYGSLWNPETEVNSEAIFVVRHNTINGQGGSAYQYLNPNGVNWGNAWTNANVELPFWQSYPEGDERRDVTWLSEYTDPNGVKRVFNPENPQADNFPIAAPAARKYLHEIPNLPGSAVNPEDFIVLRYADVLLMLAEALNEKNGGPTAEAYQLVNQVRARAGVGPLPAGMGYASFREALYHERQWELSLEQQSWYDAQRFWDLFAAQVIAHSRLGKSNPRQYPRLTVPQMEITIEEPKDRLRPIPQAALDRNRELVQNPGW